MPDDIADDVTVVVDSPLSHCPNCKAEYVNIQHPMKPPGVVVQRQCKCVYEVQQVPNGTLILVRHPEASSGGSPQGHG